MHVLLGLSHYSFCSPYFVLYLIYSVTFNQIPWIMPKKSLVQFIWNVMAHGDGRVGKWRGNWRMEWVASTLRNTSEYGVSSITTMTPLMRTPRLPVVDWTDTPTHLNGLVRFTERRNWFLRVFHHISNAVNNFWCCYCAFGIIVITIVYDFTFLFVRRGLSPPFFLFLCRDAYIMIADVNSRNM